MVIIFAIGTCFTRKLAFFESRLWEIYKGSWLVFTN